MSEIKIDSGALRSFGTSADRLAGDYYECRSKMKFILEMILPAAPKLYGEASAAYTSMLDTCEKLSELGAGAAGIAERYEYVENSLSEKADKLTGGHSGGPGNGGNGISFGQLEDIFVPSYMVSTAVQHEDWLLGKYAEKFLGGNRR